MKLILIAYLLSFCNYLDAAPRDVTSEPSELIEGITPTTWNQSNNVKSNPDFILNPAQMIRKAGYRAEAHVVMTEDGYLLTLYRIPGGNDSPPVLVMHGIASSSADWVILGKGKAIAFLLADEGYDVWLGNFRGTTYSRAHISLSPSESEFWDFSLDEMITYDLPTMITHITNITSRPLHTYIGHSMGASNFYVMASERPEIAQKVRMMIGWAPAAFLNHMKTPLRQLVPWRDKVQIVTRFFFRTGEILAQNDLMKYISTYGCDQNFAQEERCVNVLFWFCGYDPEQFNYTLLPVILAHFPGGVSIKTLVHFAQVSESGKLRPYDYGRAKNLLIYNSTEPPEYNIANITIPIALMYSEGDLMVTPEDVEQLYHILPNVMDVYKVPWPKFNHVDFMWAKDAPKLVYERTLKIMRRKV